MFIIMKISLKVIFEVLEFSKNVTLMKIPNIQSFVLGSCS
jgi:hypothetical protein